MPTLLETPATSTLPPEDEAAGGRTAAVFELIWRQWQGQSGHHLFCKSLADPLRTVLCYLAVLSTIICVSTVIVWTAY
jgi:hypothetical protein